MAGSYATDYFDIHLNIEIQKAGKAAYEWQLWRGFPNHAD
jgi:hypothetical protein